MFHLLIVTFVREKIAIMGPWHKKGTAGYLSDQTKNEISRER